MIRPSRNYVAIIQFQGKPGNPEDRYTVEAWSEDGEALILHEEYPGKLVAASTVPGFIRVTEGSTVEPRTYIPGGGWTLEYRTGQGTSYYPVIAWSISGYAELVPIVIGQDEGKSVGTFAIPGWRAIPPTRV